MAQGDKRRAREKYSGTTGKDVSVGKNSGITKGRPGKKGDAKDKTGAEGFSSLTITSPKGTRFTNPQMGVVAMAPARMKEKRGSTSRRMEEARDPETRAEADRSLRSVFKRRVQSWMESLAQNAPSEVLADALAHPTTRGSILYVLDAVPPNEEKSEGDVLREKALQRALLVREELVREAGGLQPTQWVAERLGVRRQSVDRYRTAGKLLAWSTPQGHVFPACQLDANGIVPGLDEVLKEMRSMTFWEVLAGLVTPTPSLGGRSVLEALRTVERPDERRKIREVAHAYATE